MKLLLTTAEREYPDLLDEVASEFKAFIGLNFPKYRNELEALANEHGRLLSLLPPTDSIG